MFLKLGMSFLNNKAKKTGDTVLRCLEIKAGMKIADVGCGGGYFTYEFSKKVGEAGIVYAIDTDKKRIDLIQKENNKQNIRNIIVGETIENLPNVPALDLIFLRNSFHHIENPAQYFARISEIINPQTQIAVIDYAENILWGKITHEKHFTTEEEMLEKMAQAGFLCKEKYTDLPGQAFHIYCKK